MTKIATPRTPDLVLFDGGPFARVMRAVRLQGGEVGDRARRRALVLMAVAWLPLLVLSALDGQATGGRADLPFLLDASVHVRFLLALPLLVLAEIVVNSRVRGVPGLLVERGLVPDRECAPLHAAVSAANRRCASVRPEFVILVLALGVGAWQVAGPGFLLGESSATISSWYVEPASLGGNHSLAGLWFAFVSLPLFQFVALRWYHRILVWAALMWRVSRLDLQLVAVHPDRVAGLGFLNRTAYAFLPLALAHGAMLSAVLVNQIVFAGAQLVDFGAEIALVLVFVFCLLLGPLLVLAPPLMAENQRALADYGVLAGKVAREFDARWIRDPARRQSGLLDGGEVSAMADLDAALGIIRGMRYVPVDMEAALWIAAAVLAPVLPLLLTVIPADELFKALIGLLL
ncbi:MAG: hypothetical protein RIS35_2692 [Pseudomonadota bacterium]|jgi:hypothetical protein